MIQFSDLGVSDIKSCTAILTLFSYVQHLHSLLWLFKMECYIAT